MPTGEISRTATTALLAFLLRKRNPVASRDPRSGLYGLPFGRPYRITVVILAIEAAALLALEIVAFKDDPGPAALVLASSIFGLIFLAALYGLYDGFLARIGFSEEMLVRETPFGPPLRVPWTAVISVEYSTVGNWFVFHAPGRPSIRVSIYRNGLGTFADVAGRGLERGPAGGGHYLLHEKARNPG